MPRITKDGPERVRKTGSGGKRREIVQTQNSSLTAEQRLSSEIFHKKKHQKQSWEWELQSLSPNCYSSVSIRGEILSKKYKHLCGRMDNMWALGLEKTRSEGRQQVMPKRSPQQKMSAQRRAFLGRMINVSQAHQSEALLA